MESTRVLLATGLMACIGMAALVFLLSRWERQQGEAPSCAPTPALIPELKPEPTPITRTEPVEIDGLEVCKWHTPEQITRAVWN